MSIQKNRLCDELKTEKQLFQDNQKEIFQSNYKYICILLKMALAIFLSLTMLSFFAESYAVLRESYAAALLLSFFLILYFKKCQISSMIFSYYILQIAAVLFATWSSGYLTPEKYGIMILFLLVIHPLMFLDYSIRIHIMEAIFALLYIVIAIPNEPRSMQLDELINVVMMAATACILGFSKRTIVLNNLELNRMSRIGEITDALTKLYNRRKLFDDLEDFSHGRQWRNHKETQDALSEQKSGMAALAILDIDDFKMFNDTYGHLAGDDCLKTIADTMTGYISQYEAEVYRYGGEEFVILLETLENQDIKTFFSGLNQAVAALQIKNKQVPRGIVTVSIGATKVSDRIDYQTLLLEADDALYFAKKTGKNKTVMKFEMK